MKKIVIVILTILAFANADLLASKKMPSNPYYLTYEGYVDVYYGKISSSGLSAAEQEKLGIESVFQINTTTKSFYIVLEENDEKAAIYEELLEIMDRGELVKISGNLVKGWAEHSTTINGQYTYDCTAMTLESLVRDIPSVHAYYDPFLKHANTTPYIERKEMSDEDMIVSGSLFATDRPAPDISYDFELRLPTKRGEIQIFDYLKENNPDADYFDRVIVMGLNLPAEEMKKLLTDKDAITIVGHFTQGYGERSIFMVTGILK